MNYKLKAVPTAKAKENNDQKGSKAKQILVAIDVGLNWYQAARKVDNGVVGPVDNFHSEAALLLYFEKQLGLAQRVVAVYEAGPLGFGLYRKLKAGGIECLV
jgi:transposase